MLTPLDIESKTFKKTSRGYNCLEVDLFFRDILTNYKKLYKENIILNDKMTQLMDSVEYYKTMEETLQKALILAEKTAEETKLLAHQKAEQIEQEAQLKAEEILSKAQKKLLDLHTKIEDLIQSYECYKIQIKQSLKTQLEIIEDTQLNKIDFDSKDNLSSFFSVKTKEKCTNSKKNKDDNYKNETEDPKINYL